MKKLMIIASALALLATTTGCNRQLIDITYEFDRAIVYLPNGQVVEGKVESWKDYADGDQIQVKIDGVTYLAHASNVVLIEE